MQRFFAWLGSDWRLLIVLSAVTAAVFLASGSLTSLGESLERAAWSKYEAATARKIESIPARHTPLQTASGRISPAQENKR